MLLPKPAGPVVQAIRAMLVWKSYHMLKQGCIAHTAYSLPTHPLLTYG
jgi:hypothetical protein